MDLPSGERGSYNKTCLTSSDSACEDINIKVEDRSEGGKNSSAFIISQNKG